MEKTAERILIVDDDERLAVLIERHLQQAGFNTRRACDVRRMTRLIEREHFDLIVLDLMLPDGDGMELCAQLRRRGVDTPVLMLTAKGNDNDRVRGLEIGADDYLAKPCNSAELVARMRAILRRSRRTHGAPEVSAPAVHFGPYELDMTQRLLKKGDITVPLTTGDFALLAILARNPGQPLSRDHLQATVSGREHTPDDRSIDVRVARLRKLIEGDAPNHRFIQTVWGFGYVMVLNS